jgi:alkylation response protein AidB-like acyl-CoA dehydrogenase
MIFDTALDDIDLTATALAHEFAETASEYDRTAAFPFANIERLRETRLASLVVPREYGGRGAGLVRANRVVNAIARGEASTGLVLAQHYLFHGALRANPDFPPALRTRSSARPSRTAHSSTRSGSSRSSGRPSAAGCPRSAAGCPRQLRGGRRTAGR